MIYGVDTSEQNLQGPLISLQVLYDGMPKTSGCESCAQINGKENEHWCCKTQSPSMFYSEFLKVYRNVKNWNRERRKELILRALRSYLDNSLSKGCIFYDNGCQVYDDRPFNCRMYGVIPEKNWNKRWTALKKRQGAKFEARPQCSLVGSEIPITPEMEDKWFRHTRRTEERIGVSKITINLHDLSGGSYRTFHDHLLLDLFGEDILATLTNVRVNNPSREDIDLTIDEMRKLINEKAVSS